MTHGGAYAHRPFRTEKASGLVFSRPGEYGLWWMNTASGEITSLAVELPPAYWGLWDVVDDRLLALEFSAAGEPKLVELRLPDGVRLRVIDLAATPQRESTNLSVSRDRQAVYYAHRTRLSADLIAIHFPPD